MPRPTSTARAALDQYIKQLATLGDGLTLNDFRTAQIAEAGETARAVRRTLWISGIAFMLLALEDLFCDSVLPNYEIVWIGLWAFALGGLGAISSIFLHVLKLMPQETLKVSDEFEVVGRIFLGSLFSLVFALTIIAPDMRGFFRNFSTTPSAGADASGNAKLLLPFLCGYSIPLVLGLLEKVIHAIELTIGLDDRRESPIRRPPRRK